MQAQQLKGTAASKQNRGNAAPLTAKEGKEKEREKTAAFRPFSPTHRFSHAAEETKRDGDQSGFKMNTFEKWNITPIK